MKEFLGKDFLLESNTAQVLYDNYASKMPIFDFHCHLNPQEIYEDKKFRSITEIWLGGDHYKWRLLREMGVDESYITGDKSDWEKFLKFAEVIPYTIGNPLYHWTHLELRRFFGIEEILNVDTAKVIYDKANKVLETVTARKLAKMANVKHIFTTDDPIDDLRWHKLMNEDKSLTIDVRPAFRPDKAINIELATFVPYIAKLSAVADVAITDLKALEKALSARVEFFDSLGCVCSDHALDVVMYEPTSAEAVDTILKKALQGDKLNKSEVEQYKGYILAFFGRQYHAHKWVQQYHIGALRNNSSRYMSILGADTGFDATEDQPFAAKLSAILNGLDITDQLPKTILYCLNPRDNEVLATIKNCFQQSGTIAKIQFGSGWWFNDQKDGMERQTEALSQVGLLSKFVGMLTDSRSFLSYPRHEYFRRILCNKLGNLIESGQYPSNVEFVGKIVEDICYNNAKNYFTK